MKEVSSHLDTIEMYIPTFDCDTGSSSDRPTATHRDLPTGPDFAHPPEFKSNEY